MPDPPRADAFRTSFDRFVFDRRTFELRRDGKLVKLQQQPARILSLLIDRGGELVTRDELKEAIWGDETFVDFSRGLNYCVSQIRAALDDDADSPRYLETLPGRGYRFVAPVRPVAESLRNIEDIEAPVAGRRWWIPITIAATLLIGLTTWGVRAWMRPSPSTIGVAVFDAGTNDERGWSASLHAQLLTRLASVARIPVADLAASPDSRVAWRLDGRVDQSHEQYRVTVTLRKTADGSVRWSDVFDGPPGDWIDAQNEMAVIIAQAIRYHVEGPSAGGIPRSAPRRPPAASYPPLR